MNKGTIWAIAIGAGIPCVLILIGLIGLLIKFFMKRCQKKAWDEISSLPKNMEASDSTIIRRSVKRLPSEREPLHQADALETPSGHVAVPIDENDLPADHREIERVKHHDQTLVQIQRERLNRLKEEENRIRPTMTFAHSENDIQRAIDQAQKEFEESV